MTYFWPEILRGHIYHAKESGSSETVFVTFRAAGYSEAAAFRDGFNAGLRAAGEGDT